MSTVMVDPAANDCAKSLMDGVLPVTSFMRRQMRGHRGELTLSQFRILIKISREPDLSLSSLAEHLGSSLSALSRAISGLVQKGLVARTEASGDRRQVMLSLTAQGQAVLDQAHRGAQVKMGTVLAPLDEKQRAAIADAMNLLRDLFGPLSRRDDGIAGADHPRGSDGRAGSMAVAGERRR